MLTYAKIKEYLGFEEPKPSSRLTGKNKSKKKRLTAKEQQRKAIKKVLVISSIFIGIIILIGVIGLTGMVIIYSRQLPPPGKAFSRDVAQSTNIFDRSNVQLATIHGDIDRQWVTLNNVDSNMKLAMLAAENINFYTDHGIDFLSIIRAGIYDILHHGRGPAQGGSTITQELIKNAALTQSQTIQRKIQEIILTIETDKKYTKDQILEAYLNQISFGGPTLGIKVASEQYFGIEPSQLDLAQSAFLAGIPQSPSNYSPIPSYCINETTVCRENANARAFYVLQQMIKHKDITHVTQAQVTSAQKEVTSFIFKNVVSNDKAPHFTQYVKSILQDKLGFSVNQINAGGLQVYTTLDYNMQQEAEAEIQRTYADLSNKYGFKGDDSGMVSIDPKNGEIMAMVGSPNFNSNQVNIVTDPVGAPQPGSSIKALLYMSAFKNLGISPSTIMPDIPINISSYNNVPYTPAYAPKNFSGTNAGPLTIDTALSESLNTTAVETLYTLTPTKFINDLKSFGYDYTWGDQTFTNAEGTNVNFFKTDQTNSLSYAIGGENVVFLDHVNAYTILANQGTLYPPTAILKVTDATGKVLYQYDPTNAGKNVIDAAYPYLVDKMLEHYKYLLSVGHAFVPSLFKQGYDIAGKTGTNNTVLPSGYEGNASSLTFVGYTPDLVSGFWYGNAAKPSQALSGSAYTPEGEYLIPYWGDYMLKVLPKYPKDQFQRPSDVVEEQICSDTGLLNTDGKVNCPRTTAFFQKDHIPPVDNQHIQVQVCTSDTTKLATPDMIAQGLATQQTIVTLKTIDPYFQGQLDSFVKNTDQVPTAYCTSQPIAININNPSNGKTYNPGDTVNLDGNVVDTVTGNTISKVTGLLDGTNAVTLSLTTGTDYAGSFQIAANATAGAHELTIQATDNQGNTQTSNAISITVSAPAGNSGSGSGVTSSDISILSPTNGQIVTPGVNTKLSFSVNTIDPGSVTNPVFNIYSGSTVVESNVVAKRNSGNNEWDANYQFAANSGQGYSLNACLTSNGQTACSSKIVIATL